MTTKGAMVRKSGYRHGETDVFVVRSIRLEAETSISPSAPLATKLTFSVGQLSLAA